MVRATLCHDDALRLGLGMECATARRATKATPGEQTRRKSGSIRTWGVGRDGGSGRPGRVRVGATPRRRAFQNRHCHWHPSPTRAVWNGQLRRLSVRDSEWRSESGPRQQEPGPPPSLPVRLSLDVKTSNCDSDSEAALKFLSRLSNLKTVLESITQTDN